MGFSARLSKNDGASMGGGAGLKLGRDAVGMAALAPGSEAEGSILDAAAAALLATAGVARPAASDAVLSAATGGALAGESVDAAGLVDEVAGGFTGDAIGTAIPVADARAAGPLPEAA